MFNHLKKSKNWDKIEKNIDERLAETKREKEIYEKKAEIKTIKQSMKWHPSTTKLIVAYLFLLFNIILIYSGVAMWVFADLSYLSVIITDICAQIAAFLIYAVKAYFGKKEEEKTKLERDKLGLNDDAIYEDDESEDESAEEDSSIVELQEV